MTPVHRPKTRSAPRTGEDGGPCRRTRRRHKPSWRLRAAGMAAAVFCLTSLLAGAIVFNMHEEHLRRERERVAYIASNYAGRIQHVIGVIVHSAYTLEALVKQGNGVVPHFDVVAEDMMRLYPGLLNVALAPEGVIRKIFPPESNRAALGHDLFRDPRRADEAEAARDTGRLTVAGPFPLIQGGTAAIGRLPVFLEDAAGTQRFWGFVCASFQFPDVLAPVHLSELEAQGYAYSLWRIVPETGKRQVLAASQTDPPARPMEYRVELPNTSWTFSIAPVDGWEDYAALAIPATVSVIICLLLAFPAGLLVSLAARKKALEYMSRTDNLTGLPNRRLFMERLDQAMEESADGRARFAVCYMDLNGFKAINDTLGHRAGDDLLTGFAARLAAGLAAGDTAARLGGDEFVLLLRDVGDAAACGKRLEAVLDGLHEPFCLGGPEVRVTSSIGIALYPDDGRDGDTLMRQADNAMYGVKRAGNGAEGYAFCTPHEV